MRRYWNVLWLSFWFLSQTLGFAVAAQPHVTVHVVPAVPARDQGQPGNDGYDADFQSGWHCDPALLSVTTEDLSDPLGMVLTIPAYDSWLVSTIGIADCPYAPALVLSELLAGKSGVWSLGPGPRGLAIESKLGGNRPAGCRVIDRFENGVATSIKSIDLKAATYQSAQALGSRLNGYMDRLAGWTGQTTPYAGVVIQPGQVTARTCQIAVPAGGMSAAQQAVLNAAAPRAQGLGLRFIVTPVP